MTSNDFEMAYLGHLGIPMGNLGAKRTKAERQERKADKRTCKQAGGRWRQKTGICELAADAPATTRKAARLEKRETRQVAKVAKKELRVAKKEARQESRSLIKDLAAACRAIGGKFNKKRQVCRHPTAGTLPGAVVQAAAAGEIPEITAAPTRRDVRQVRKAERQATRLAKREVRVEAKAVRQAGRPGRPGKGQKQLCRQEQGRWNRATQSCDVRTSTGMPITRKLCKTEGLFWGKKTCHPNPQTKGQCRKAGGSWNRQARQCVTPGAVMQPPMVVPQLPAPGIAPPPGMLPTTRKECKQGGYYWDRRRKACSPIPTTKRLCTKMGFAWNQQARQCAIPTAPLPSPGPSAMQQCLNAGGQWNQTTRQCSVPSVPDPRAACVTAGGIWDAVDQVCGPAPVAPPIPLPLPRDALPTDTAQPGMPFFPGPGAGVPTSYGPGYGPAITPDFPIDTLPVGPELPGDMPGAAPVGGECSVGFQLPATYNDRWGEMTVLEIYCPASQATAAGGPIQTQFGAVPSVGGVEQTEMAEAFGY